MRKFVEGLFPKIEKLGKQNIMLIIFLIIILVITGIYQTFSLYTESSEVSIVDGLKTFKFILGPDTENSVTIASGSTRNIAITVSNNEKLKLKYGIYYSSAADLSEIELGYKWDTEHLPNGDIPAGKDYLVTIQIDNNSTSDITLTFGIKYGLETGGDLQLEEGEQWLEQKWNFPLNEVAVGSYVKYSGNYGCTTTACQGQNANYVSETNLGYCSDATYQYQTNGWRIGYIKEESAYLTSAGSPECLCTNSDGSKSNTSCSSYETTANLPNHLENLKQSALKYCNTDYSFNATCDYSTTWPLNAADFKNITGNLLNANSCFYSSEDLTCGYTNDLIDNGGHYWFATPYATTTNKAFYWSADVRFISNYANTNALFGLRPVIKLDPNIKVVGGTGTYNDPYQISGNNYFANYLINLYNADEPLTTTISNVDSNPTISLNTSKQIMLDNYDNYRYYGSDPNNYVLFNNELWRIISISRIYSDTTETNANIRVKLIRNEMLNYYSYDTSDSTVNDGQGLNDWKNSDISITLNNTYYNQEEGTCYNNQNDATIACDFTTIGLNETARNMIADALYYLGGVNIGSDAYANELYNYERGTTVYTTNDTSWLGKIGLMYPSDYAYATDFTVCSNPFGWGGSTTGYNSDANCSGTNWLLFGDANNRAEWIITPFSSSNYQAFHINPTGYVSGAEIWYPQVIRPTVYLKPNVIITGGTGTSLDPYTLGLTD